MIATSIGFSAQFGGRDAADAVLPHFHALKAAACSIQIDSFPFPKLAFILRVDGSVQRYGRSGVEHVKVDRKGAFVSVDITVEEQHRDDLVAYITNAILDAPRSFSPRSRSVFAR